MFTISIKHNVAEFAAKWGAQAQKQVPFATALALNAVANIAKDKLREAMAHVFDRPTPYTLNSLRVERASKTKLTAAVKFKDDAGKGIPATKYLLPQVEGGRRSAKRLERALTYRGLLPTGWVTVPGQGAKLDAYGNMARGQIVQILSALGAAEMTSGYAMNRTQASMKRKRNAPKFFVVAPGTHPRLLPGVYQRFGFAMGSAVKPMLIFVSGAKYAKRLPYLQTVQRAVDQNFEREFDIAMRRAIATATP